MTTVFIGGSIKITRLNEDINGRLNNIIQKGFTIFIGDAHGVDKAVQKYLSDKGYKNVCVFCMGNICRNNVGNWESKHIIATNGFKGSDYYGLKDLEMAKATDYGFMIWDGKSKGTLNNIRNLLKQNKKILLYFYPQKEFFNLLTFDNLENLLAQCDRNGLEIVDQKVKVDTLSHTLWPETRLLSTKQVQLQPLQVELIGYEQYQPKSV